MKVMRSSVVGQHVASTSKAQRSLGVSRRPQAVSAKFGGGGKPKAAGSAMVCVDCGYIYTGKVDFAELPASYRCPVCAADKKRFKAFQGQTSRSNDNKAMAARLDALREQLAARGESIDDDSSILIYSLAFVAVVLGASYYFTVLGR